MVYFPFALNEHFKNIMDDKGEDGVKGISIEVANKWDRIRNLAEWNRFGNKFSEVLRCAMASLSNEGILIIRVCADEENYGAKKDFEKLTRLYQLEIQLLILEVFGQPLCYSYELWKPGESLLLGFSPKGIPWVRWVARLDGVVDRCKSGNAQSNLECKKHLPSPDVLDQPWEITPENAGKIHQRIYKELDATYRRGQAQNWACGKPILESCQGKLVLEFPEVRKEARNRCLEEENQSLIQQIIWELYGQNWPVEYGLGPYIEPVVIEKPKAPIVKRDEEEDEDDYYDDDEDDEDEDAPQWGFRTTAGEKVVNRLGQRKSIWGNRIVSGILHLISGEPGAAKTTVFLDLIFRVYAGKEWPDGIPCPKGLKGRKALFIDSDQRALAHAELAGKYGTTLDCLDYFEMEKGGYRYPVKSYSDGERVKGGIFRGLRAKIQTNRYWCLVIDTIARYAGEHELNSPAAVSRIVGGLQTIAQESGIPIFLLGHTNSQGEAYGKHLLGACEIAWRIDWPGKREFRRLVSGERALAEPFAPLQFRFNEAGILSWEESPLEGPRKPKESRMAQEAEEWIIEALRAKGEAVGGKGGEAWKALQEKAEEAGHKSTTFRRAVDSLLASGVIQKIQAPGVKGRPVSTLFLSPNKNNPIPNPA